MSASTVTLVFSSNETGALFECRVDTAAFAGCSSPKRLTGLAAGPHTFEVRAKDTAGNVDASPATRSWTTARRVDLCGQILGSRTLSTAEADVYVVTCALAIPAGATLTVESGTIIKVATGPPSTSRAG